MASTTPLLSFATKQPRQSPAKALQLRGSGPPGVAILVQEKIWPGYQPIWLGDGGPIGLDSSFNPLYPQVYPNLFTDPMTTDQRQNWRRKWFGCAINNSVQSVPSYGTNTAIYSMSGSGNCPTIVDGNMQQQEADGPIPPLIPGVTTNCILACTYSWGANMIATTPAVSTSASDWSTASAPWTQCAFDNGSFRVGGKFESFNPVPFAGHLATAYTRLQARSFPAFTTGPVVAIEHFNEYDWDSTEAQPPGPTIPDVFSINNPGSIGDNDCREYKKITLLNPSDYDGTPVSGIQENRGDILYNVLPNALATDWFNFASGAPEPVINYTLATGWLYESNEADAQFAFVNGGFVGSSIPFPTSRFFLSRVRYNPSGSYPFFIARCKILPRQAGDTTLTKASSQNRFSEVQIVTVGTTSVGVPIEIPSPQSVGGGTDFAVTYPGAGVYAGQSILSVGEACFMVLGETSDAWSARTGCPITGPDASGMAYGQGSGSINDNTGQ